MAINPARAASLASAGMASSRLPRTMSTCATSSGTLARTFSMCGGTKWIIRSSRSGKSRSGAGAPIASGLKKLRGNFISEIQSNRLRLTSGRTLHHFTAHQLGLRRGRHHTFAHQYAAQRSDAVDEIERQSARAMRRQKFAQQAPIQKIDSK